MNQYVVTNPELGYWNGKNWVKTIESAKRFSTQNALWEEMQAKGYNQIKLIIIKV